MIDLIWWLMVAALVAEILWCIVLVAGLVAVKILGRLAR